MGTDRVITEFDKAPRLAKMAGDRGIFNDGVYLKYGLKLSQESRPPLCVTWLECTRSECRELEKQIYDQAKEEGEPLPWSERR